MGIKPFKPFAIPGMKITDNMTANMNRFFERAGVGEKNRTNTANFKALQAAGLSLLNFSLNGSSNEPVVPPIMWGVLRGSGSVFVDNILIGDTKSSYPDGTPNREYTATTGTNINSVTIGYNTAYAARLHETTWTPGGERPSPQAAKNPGILADVGNKWVEKHVFTDANTLLGIYTDVFKKEMGT